MDNTPRMNIVGLRKDKAPGYAANVLPEVSITSRKVTLTQLSPKGLPQNSLKQRSPRAVVQNGKQTAGLG